MYFVFYYLISQLAEEKLFLTLEWILKLGKILSKGTYRKNCSQLFCFFLKKEKNDKDDHGWWIYYDIKNEEILTSPLMNFNVFNEIGIITTQCSRRQLTTLNAVNDKVKEVDEIFFLYDEVCHLCILLWMLFLWCRWIGNTCINIVLPNP